MRASCLSIVMLRRYFSSRKQPTINATWGRGWGVGVQGGGAVANSCGSAIFGREARVKL